MISGLIFLAAGSIIFITVLLMLRHDTRRLVKVQDGYLSDLERNTP
jgi:hypothetical protein